MPLILVDNHHQSNSTRSEFLARVLTLSSLCHPNVVSLVGFCADGHHRILVHEYMPLGSLQNHLHDRSPGKALLDWNTRMNIAAGVARGLEYLHHKGVVYGKHMSNSDILLGDGYQPKLSHYREGDHEVERGGVLLELITGWTPFDPAQAVTEDQHLVIWATRWMDRSQFRWMADLALQDRYPSMDLQEALKVASMCIHEQPSMRPPIGAVVAALSRLAAYDDQPPESSHHAAPH